MANTINPSTWSGANSFLRYGGSNLASTQDFSRVEMQPRELYVGQLYAAIRTRANRVADLAKNHTETRKFDDQDLEIDDVHPYLNLINTSPSFSNTYFWRAMSTFLDLTGTAYVLVIRQKRGNLTSEPKEFKIVNPYNLTKVAKASDQSEFTYIETRGGAWREIPPEQLIICQSFNPFNLGEGYGMVEAAQDDHYSIKQARDYTRKAIKKNVGQRGLLTTDVILDDEKFANFKTAIKAGEIGDFLFGNGPGAVTYTDMQIDLDRLALDKINKISTDSLIMVSGASKTLLGIEESGTTRETARVQKDLFTENHAIPQLDDILDPLNQDYKNNYPNEYATNQLEMYVDSPLNVDKDGELKDAQVDKFKAETANILITAGYEPDSVSKYLELDDALVFEERQKPEGRKVKITMPGGEETEVDDPEEAVQAFNKFAPGLEAVIRGHESSLANQVQNIEGQILQAVLPKLTDKFKNQLRSEEGQAISKEDEKRIERDLALALAAFGSALVTVFAGQTMNKRFAEFALPGQFTMSKEVNAVIDKRAKKTAKSHVETFVKDIFKAAREAGQEGLSRDGIVSRLTGMFPETSKKNATRIARTESYKTVNLAQYEADKQFLAQNDLETRAYKQWVVHSSHPCSYCIEMSKREPVPFADDFLGVGDSVKAQFEKDGSTVTREYVASFESIESGTLHPNCSCSYELIIRKG